MNSYFATLLQQENPNLRGKPVGIVKDIGRTCLIAVSKEAKKFGIKTGSLLADAQVVCPEIITLKAEFDRYLDATHRLKKIFSSVSPDYYIYSLDEVFVDITNCRTHLYPDPVKLATDLQQQVKDELGEWVTCNVGISHNRLLAKLGSGVGPKGGVIYITPENQDAYLASTGFEDICGIGFRLAKKLAQFRVTTPYQIRFIDDADLLPVFGPFWTPELKRIAYGEDSHNLSLVDRELPHMKSVSRSITGYRLYDDENEIAKILLNLIEEVTHKTRQMGLAGRYVSIYMTGQGQFWHGHRTLKYYIDRSQEMFDILYHQLYQNWQRSFKVVKFAVGLSKLKSIEYVQPSLFTSDSKRNSVVAAMDQINDKYGLFTLRSGRLINQQIIRPEVTGFLGDRTYYGL